MIILFDTVNYLYLILSDFASEIHEKSGITRDVRRMMRRMYRKMFGKNDEKELLNHLFTGTELKYVMH